MKTAFWIELSQERKHGSTSMILKQNSSPNSGFPHQSSGPIKFKSERSVKKVMATVFWDSEGVVLVDFLEGKKTVTGTYYVEVLRKLRAKLAEKRPGNSIVEFFSITTTPQRILLGSQEMF